jgi:hypothetical protein
MKTILILFLFISCTTKKISKPETSSTVDLVTPEKSEVVIDTVIDTTQETPTVINKKYNFLLLAGGYDSYVLIDLLKFFEKKQIIEEINEFYSCGIGSLILALYANSESFNQFEWKIFKFKSILKSEKEIFSNDWNKVLKQFIEGEFQNKKIENLNKKLAFIKIDEHANKIKIIRKGEIKKLLMNELDSRLNKKHQSLMWSKMFDLKRLDNQEGLNLIVINTAPQKLNMKNPDGYIWGILSRKFSLGRDFENYIPLDSDVEFVDSWNTDYKLDISLFEEKFAQILDKIKIENTGY